MIRKLIGILLTFHLLPFFSIAQQHDTTMYKSVDDKVIIDSNAYHKWPTIGSAMMSNDGEYVAYQLNNVPTGGYTMVLKNVKGTWEMRFPGVRGMIFSSDSRMAFFIKANDSLYMVRLGNSVVARIPKVSSFQVSTKAGRSLAYKLDNPEGELVLYNLNTKMATSYLFVNQFLLSDDGKTLLVQTDSIVGSRKLQTLRWINIDNRKIYNVWNGTGFINMVLDAARSQFVFIVDSSIEGKSSKSCWYYKRGDSRATLFIDSQSKGLGNNMSIRSLSDFSRDGSHFYFSVANESEEKVRKKKNTDLPPVNIWSYLDTKLQSAQLQEKEFDRTFAYVINVQNRRIRRIERAGEIIMNGSNSDVPLILHMKEGADMRESGWNRAAHLSSYIESVKYEKRIDADRYGIISEPVSPKGKYVIFFNKNDYYSYEIASGRYHNITEKISTSWSNYYKNDQLESPRGIAAWFKNEEFVLIYDKYDIWLVDPIGKRDPINITNGYGVKNNIIFFLGLGDYASEGIVSGVPLILNAVSISTKRNGFFKMNLNRKSDPEELSFGNYVYDLIGNPYSSYNYPPVKARDKKRYIVSRMTATESRNFFYTTNFKDFIQISNVCPEREYNWYTTELHSWKSFNGDTLQGVLYKPQNFDEKKKYPIILNYYEKKTFNLNAFLTPHYPSNEIDIPTMVSNGYLVFTPDINYVIGDPMQGTYDAVVSAAKYLSGFPYVNGRKMGIQGFSFGGVQTNYLVTHTNLFAAACSGAGMSDFISGYLGVSGEGFSLQTIFEKGGQNRMGAKLWDNLDMYIKSSAVLSADKANTPLLMMHTTKDRVCLFSQALEFFNALRRLGRKVWLLEYTEGIHSVHGRAAVDYGIRMMQFFDHYLKDKIAPKWMTTPTSAIFSTDDNGLELDYENVDPGKGLLNDLEDK